MTQPNLPRLTDRELEIMQLLWQHGQLSASEIAAHFLKTQRQLRNTTYTFITKLIDKRVIRRTDPGFICIPLYECDTLLLHETRSFLDKVYDGSLERMFAQFLRQQALTPQEIAGLQKLIDKARKEGDPHDPNLA